MNYKNTFGGLLVHLQIKNGVRCLFLLIFFLLCHFFVGAQQIVPRWVGDLDDDNNGYCNPTHLAVDKENNIYITGYFFGTVDFDPSTGVKSLSSGSISSIFVGKYKPDGSLIWVDAFAGSEDNANRPNNIAVDKEGNVSVTGSFDSDSLDADPGPGKFNLVNKAPGNEDLFIIHLDTNGNFLWANSVGGTGNEIGNGAVSDSQDNVIVTGSFSSFLTIGDSTYSPPQNSVYGLIEKYNPAGSLLWSVVLKNKQTGQTEGVASCAVDDQDNVVVSGFFNSSVNFNPLGAAFNLTAGGGSGATFLAKYAPSGTLAWANAINGPAISQQSVVGIDPQNNVYLGAVYHQSTTFSPSFTLNSPDPLDLFFAKYSPAGMLQFAKSVGGAGAVVGSVFIGISSNSNLYLTGYFSGTINANPNAGNAASISENGGFFVGEYDPNGNYIYAFSRGSASCANTPGNAIAIDQSNNIDLVGTFCSTVNFDPGNCTNLTLTATSSVQVDGFAAQYARGAIVKDLITAPAITAFCSSGTPGSITGNVPSGGSGAYIYQWQSSAESVNFNNIAGADSISYTPPTITATTFYRGTVSANCFTADTSNLIELIVSAPPAAPQAAGDSVCAGTDTTLSVTSPTAGLTYNWYPSAAGDTSLFSGTSFKTSALNSTTTYYVEADNGGCSSSRTAVTVKVLQPLPEPVAAVDTTTISSITFGWAAVPGATGYLVSIDGGQTYAAPTSGSTGLSDVVSGLQPKQSVTLMVEAVGNTACELSAASAAATGTTQNQVTDIIYVPNAFTPNGDGRNDQMHVHGVNIQSLKFYIYDQWGEVVFTSTNQQNGWDGTYKGAKEPVGVYVYYLEAVMNDGQRITKKGTIAIIK